MRLKCLAGAYAGQVLDYGVVAGLAALRSGMAERLDAPRTVAPEDSRPRIADRPRPGLASGRRQRKQE